MIVTNWQAEPTTAAAAKKYSTGSPNIAAIWVFVSFVWGWTSLGHGVHRRPIRKGSSPSDHWFGAAGDFRYYSAPLYDRAIIDRDVRPALDVQLAFLIEHHEVLGIQRIHDYYGARIWSANRKAWKNHSGNAMGASWATYVHVSTSADRWGDDRPVDERLGLAGPEVAEAPVFDPARQLWGLYPLNGSKGIIHQGVVGDLVAYAQGVLRVAAFLDPGAVSDPGRPDGRFGPRTRNAVLDFQNHKSLGWSGIVGPRTWAELDGLASLTWGEQ